MNKRSRTLQSRGRQKKKQKKNILTIVLSSACILVVVTLFIIIMRLDALQIQGVEIRGNKNLTTEEVTSSVMSILREGSVFFIPKTNRSIYPKGSIEKRLTEDFHRIRSLDISLQDSHTLVVTIDERDATALLCEGFHEENKGISDEQEKCSYVDEYGFAFASAPQFSTGIYMKYYGTTTLETDQFKKLQVFAGGALRAGLVPLGILIDEEGSYEMYIKNKDLTEAVVYFDDRVPFSKTLSNLVVFWTSSTTKKKNGTSTPSFDSINLRFGNTVYYVTK